MMIHLLKILGETNRARAMPQAARAFVLRMAPCFTVATRWASIAIAGLGLTACSMPRGLPGGEATHTSYQMADLLAREQTPAGALARRGLADGHLSASEADSMWDAYHAEKTARDDAETAEIINRWKRRT